MVEYGIADVQQVESWDDDSDVVVAGLGAAGSCAAIEARESDVESMIAYLMMNTPEPDEEKIRLHCEHACQPRLGELSLDIAARSSSRLWR